MTKGEEMLKELGFRKEYVGDAKVYQDGKWFELKKELKEINEKFEEAE